MLGSPEGNVVGVIALAGEAKPVNEIRTMGYSISQSFKRKHAAAHNVNNVSRFSAVREQLNHVSLQQP